MIAGLIPMTAVMLLGAGHGTRLRPLTDERPKALVPIGDRPVIAHQLERLRATLVKPRIVVNAHHLAEQMVEFLGAYDPGVQVIVETELLGTAGGVKGAAKFLGHQALIIANADVLSTVNYSELLSKLSAYSMVMCVAPKPAGHGTVGVDENCRIVRLRSEKFGREASGGDYIGVAAIRPDKFRLLPERGCLVGDFILPLLRSGIEIHAHVVRTGWMDIGTIASYATANFDWLREQETTLWSDSEARISSEVSPSEVIVGRRAQISGTGPLKRVIIWPYAHLDAPLSNAIVTSSGSLVPIPSEASR
jgi:mannose-1-phosphate guanylyltransferase